MDNTINLNTLQTTVNFIDLMSMRGNIRGEELLEIGLLRKQYADFINQAQQSIKEAEQKKNEEIKKEGEVNNG